MGYWQSRGLRGSNLEETINRTNKLYFEDNLAVVQKIPTSIKPVKLDNERGTISLAYFDEKSTVDYIGNVQGIPICFDAKETNKPSLPIANIHEHQIEFMDKFEKQGGISFILVYFGQHDEYYMLDIKTLLKFYNNAKNGGRKSIPYSAFEKKYQIFSQDRYLLHYLETLNEYLNNKED